MLGAEGSKNVALAAEIADGWLPMFFSPKMDGFYRDALAEGFARPTARRAAADFEVPAFVPVVVHDDIETAANLVRPAIALYIGGMGAKTMNFHADHFARLGYEAHVAKIQERYLSPGARSRQWAPCRPPSSKTSRWSARRPRSVRSCRAGRRR